MRRTAIAFLVIPMLGASAPPQPQAQSLEQSLREARAEQTSAEAETAKLEKAAAEAGSEAQRLQAKEAAAAQEIEAAEARITTADAQFRLATAQVAAERQRLAQQQRPVSSLLAGLAVMARRPPLMALADRGGTDNFVKVSVLLASTLPVIRSRTRALSAQLQAEQRLVAQALSARAELVRSRQALASKRNQFAALEQRAFARSIAKGGEALATGDVAIAAGEEAQQLQSRQSSSRSARQVAATLASEAPAPASPFAAAGSPFRPPFAYMLPVDARVENGLGAIDDSGVRSRGLTFGTAPGTPISVPADGIVRYSGPFRDFDGIVLIEHGGGWLTLVVNVASTLKPGEKVRIGDPLGRALGPINVELSHNGRQFSPALIAGSSQSLSKTVKGG